MHQLALPLLEKASAHLVRNGLIRLRMRKSFEELKLQPSFYLRPMHPGTRPRFMVYGLWVWHKYFLLFRVQIPKKEVTAEGYIVHIFQQSRLMDPS